jgi:hypothetical protein
MMMPTHECKVSIPCDALVMPLAALMAELDEDVQRCSMGHGAGSWRIKTQVQSRVADRVDGLQCTVVSSGQ